ncbi:MFS transporter [Marihabitans asiaticum]|uniref:Putative MFS family arabinose efflux permease n=1 Tax=Marihabitans asiaticum TaxID=415218 RepID=A0A560WHC7_9MICO|nr:MFS transporter [Marihabitans asiaticum]TWD17077.1 putative MFS family arabinose efflux permease [Marihabitans asiaticum]
MTTPATSLLPVDVPAGSIEPGVRGFWRALPREGRFLLSTVALQHLGRGMTLPFTVIYLGEVRGFSLEVAGALLGATAVVAAVYGPIAGTFVDKVGARLVVMSGSILASIGTVLLAATTNLTIAVLMVLFLGLAHGTGWSASNSLISAIVAGPLRQRYFGVNFALLNLGIGVGGLLAGVVVDVDRPMTFVLLFLLDAVLVLIPVIWLLGPLRHVHGRALPGADDDRPSYRTVLRRPGFGWILGVTALSSIVGYGQMEAGIPAFARSISQVSTEAVGALFAANTVVIVALQFTVLQRIEGHRRTRVMLAMLAIWMLAYGLLGLSGLLPGSLAAAVLAVSWGAVFGLGETLLQPSIPAMVNDAAPDHLRGRMNAANSTAFMLGAVVGPVLAGQILGKDQGWLFVAVMVVGLLGCAAMVLKIERIVPPAINGVPESNPSP